MRPKAIDTAITLKLPNRLRARADAAAAEKGHTRSEFVRAAIGEARRIALAAVLAVAAACVPAERAAAAERAAQRDAYLAIPAEWTAAERAVQHAVQRAERARQRARQRAELAAQHAELAAERAAQLCNRAVVELAAAHVKTAERAAAAAAGTYAYEVAYDVIGGAATVAAAYERAAGREFPEAELVLRRSAYGEALEERRNAAEAFESTVAGMGAGRELDVAYERLEVTIAAVAAAAAEYAEALRALVAYYGETAAAANEAVAAIPGLERAAERAATDNIAAVIEARRRSNTLPDESLPAARALATRGTLSRLRRPSACRRRPLAELPAPRSRAEASERINAANARPVRRTA